jgi:hypothetical protein
VASVDTSRARPSREFQTLNTALIALGVSRDGALRDLTPLTEKRPVFADSLPMSVALAMWTSANVWATILAEPETHRLSRMTGD